MLLSIYDIHIINPFFLRASCGLGFHETLWEMKCPWQAAHGDHAAATLDIRALTLLVSEALETHGNQKSVATVLVLPQDLGIFVINPHF